MKLETGQRHFPRTAPLLSRPGLAPLLLRASAAPSAFGPPRLVSSCPAAGKKSAIHARKVQFNRTGRLPIFLQFHGIPFNNFFPKSEITLIKLAKIGLDSCSSQNSNSECLNFIPRQELSLEPCEVVNCVAVTIVTPLMQSFKPGDEVLGKSK